MIHGSRALPPGFDHPQATEEARAVAEQGTVLRVEVGSGVHGTSISGQDDRDEMGRGGNVRRHTAWDRPGGLANRSGAGDLDVVIYSARK